MLFLLCPSTFLKLQCCVVSCTVKLPSITYGQTTQAYAHIYDMYIHKYVHICTYIWLCIGRLLSLSDKLDTKSSKNACGRPVARTWACQVAQTVLQMRPHLVSRAHLYFHGSGENSPEPVFFLYNGTNVGVLTFFKQAGDILFFLDFWLLLATPTEQAKAEM